jgi:hypothetical protein
MQMGLCAEAVPHFERFIALAPRGDTRVIEAAAMRDQCRAALKAPIAPATATATAAPSPPVATPPPVVLPPTPKAPDEPPPNRLWLALSLTAGVAAISTLAAGTALYLGAKSDHDQWLAPGPAHCVPNCDPVAVDHAQKNEQAAYALFAVGGVLAGLDAVLWPIAIRRARRGRAAWVVPVAGGVGMAGTF